MAKKNLKVNVIYQTLYQILATILPLVTSPYISRVIGSEGLGVYSYTSSVATYFMLFAMLGVNNYGARSIAMVKENRSERSKSFCEIFTLQIVLTAIFTIAYLILALSSEKENLAIALIQAIIVINCFFDINWLYFGIEEIKITVIRNCSMKLLTLVSIFVFVHNAGDLWKYTLIMTLSTLLSELVLFANIRKYIDFVKVEFHGVIRHLKSNFILFIPILALSVYHYMDKTMLGLLSTYRESGYYYNVDRIINIPTGIITGLGTVMLPRFSQIVGERDKEKFNNLFEKTIELILCAATPIVFGIFAISDNFIPWFLGPGYMDCSVLLKVMVIVVYFKALSQAIRTQYLIPCDKNKEYIIAITAGAGLNFVINYFLIIRMGAMGAVIGTLISEGIVCMDHIRVANKEIPICTFIAENVAYPIFGIIMVMGVGFIAYLGDWMNATILICVEVIGGAIIYGILIYIYWNIKKSGLCYSEMKKRMPRLFR